MTVSGVMVVLALLLGSMIVGTIFVGPLFGFLLVVIAGALFALARSAVHSRDAGVAAAQRPAVMRRIAALLFLVALIGSVTVQGFLYHSPDACADIEWLDWLDNKADGQCQPYLQAIMRAESFFFPAQYYIQ